LKVPDRMSDKSCFGLGLVGCGSFGLFCLKAFSEMPEVRIAAVADASADAAAAAARKFAGADHVRAKELIARDDVDIVHIATPPSAHRDLALAALRAGKHVLCEKPLALNISDAHEVLAAARDARRIAPVNFMMRHNDVVDATRRVIDSGVLGEVLAGRLTNCAFDSFMPPGHWFWDKGISGGIFIEHGVHFFDLYAHWLGAGKVISAHAETRQGTGQEDRVTCTVRHDRGAIVSHYHGFDQVLPMDRADHRLVCELGEIRVAGWIPLSLALDAAVDDAGAEKLAACCDGCDVKVVETFGSAEAAGLVGRGLKRSVTKRISLTYCPSPDKYAVYAEALRALLADQIAYVRDPAHARRVTEANGRDSLALAASAANLAAR